MRTGRWEHDEPVASLTLARMRLPEVPRFLRWGRPVERLVRVGSLHNGDFSREWVIETTDDQQASADFGTLTVMPGKDFSMAIAEASALVAGSWRPLRLSTLVGLRWLAVVGQTIGVLFVYYANEAPSAHDQETVVLFATQAAVAVESLHLFTAVRDFCGPSPQPDDMTAVIIRAVAADEPGV